jgi:hypothetical protein
MRAKPFVLMAFLLAGSAALPGLGGAKTAEAGGLQLPAPPRLPGLPRLPAPPPLPGLPGLPDPPSLHHSSVRSSHHGRHHHRRTVHRRHHHRHPRHHHPRHAG